MHATARGVLQRNTDIYSMVHPKVSSDMEQNVFFKNTLCALMGKMSTNRYCAFGRY